MENNYIEGQIRLTRSGTGFLDFPDKASIRVPNRNLNTALDKDIVRTTLEKNHQGKEVGKVVKVMKRFRNKFVGTVDKEKGKYFIIPDDNKFYMDIFVPKKYTGKLKQNQKVQVEIKEWTNPRENPEGKILKIIGKKGEHESEMESILLEKNVDLEFPKEVEREAEKIKKEISKEEIERRKDMREILTFTIDPIDAKDFDDAISYENLPNGNLEIGVHIADVSHYVLPGTELDKEAKERAFSVYLVDRTIPMLPEILSNDVCSLNPNEDKLAFTALFEFNKDGKRVGHWIGKTIINSDKRFSYEEAQRVLDGPRIDADKNKAQMNTDDNTDFFEELDALNKLAKKMHEGRVERGSILFDRDEVKIDLDKNGKPIKIYKKKRLDTHKLVEEYMLLANREVTEHVEKHCKKKDLEEVFVYRIHDLPNEEKLQELSIFLKGLGYDLDLNDGVNPKEINRLIKEVEGRPEEDLIKTSLIRSMAKAEYSTKNIGHFGLAFSFYTHFTSPIRRYPDLLVHRLLERHLKNEPISRKELVTLQKITQDSSGKEISASEAERESKKYKKIEYMQDKIGQVFEGVISGVTDWGLYVEDTKTGVEGLVTLSSIGDDFYKTSSKYAVVGERKGKKYRLGDKVKVKLTRADLNERRIDFIFV